MKAAETDSGPRDKVITPIKPYPALKPSGLEWLGEVPEHWEMRRFWEIADTRSEKNRPELDLLSVFLGRGVIPYGQGGGQVHKPSLDLSGYQTVYPGDLVLNNQQAWRGSLGVSGHHGIISPAYLVFSLSVSVNPQFANYLFQSRVMVAQFVTASKGVGDIQRDVHTPWLRNTRVPLPPLPEQAAIVRYLDHVDRRISRYIRAKQRLIELLEEEKQVVIHRAVTRGLDLDVPLKPSGVEWLGDVPEHWEVRRSRHVFREVDRRSTAGQETHLSMSQKLGLIPSSGMEGWRLVAESYVGAKLCEPGDIVLNRLKAHLGVFALAREAGLVSADYTVLRPRIEVDSRYFEAVYRTTSCRVELRKRTKGIVEGFWRLYTPDFYEVPVPVPPVAEQLAITLYLGSALGDVDRSVERIRSELALLSEYRTRLIADVVTGKLDVREAAADLPEVDPADLEDIIEIDDVAAGELALELEEVAT